jgi:spore coat polysaccharide biosynthesis protein SpsF
VVRVTSDCPLIDPEIVDDTVNAFRDRRVDYASNVFPRTYPRGLDAEVFSVAALDRAWSEAREPHQREHVTPYFYENPQKFRQASLTGIADYSRYRWTLDTREDLELLRTIYSRFDGRDNFSWQEVIQLMEREPELAELNSEVLQKSVREH